MKIITLSESDKAEILELVREKRSRRGSTVNRPSVPDELGFAPEVYVATPAKGGIPPLRVDLTHPVDVEGLETEGGDPLDLETGDPLDSSEVGTANNYRYRPGYVLCDIYKLSAPALIDAAGTPPKVETGELPELNLVGLQKRVYNFGPTRIPEFTFMLVERDKWGAWWSTYQPAPSGIPFLAQITGQLVTDSGAEDGGTGHDGIIGGSKSNAYAWVAVEPFGPIAIEPLLSGVKRGTNQWNDLDSSNSSVSRFTAFEIRGWNDYNFWDGTNYYYPECLVVMYPMERDQNWNNCTLVEVGTSGIVTIGAGPSVSDGISPKFVGLQGTVTLTDMADSTITEVLDILDITAPGDTFLVKPTLAFGPLVNVKWTAKFCVFDGSEQYEFWATIKEAVFDLGHWIISFTQLGSAGAADLHGRYSHIVPFGAGFTGYRWALMDEHYGAAEPGTSSALFAQPTPKVGDLVKIRARLGNSGPAPPSYDAYYNVNVGYTGYFTDADGHKFYTDKGVILGKVF